MLQSMQCFEHPVLVMTGPGAYSLECTSLAYPSRPVSPEASQRRRRLRANSQWPLSLETHQPADTSDAKLALPPHDVRPHHPACLNAVNQALIPTLAYASAMGLLNELYVWHLMLVIVMHSLGLLLNSSNPSQLTLTSLKPCDHLSGACVASGAHHSRRL